MTLFQPSLRENAAALNISSICSVNDIENIFPTWLYIYHISDKENIKTLYSTFRFCVLWRYKITIPILMIEKHKSFFYLFFLYFVIHKDILFVSYIVEKKPTEPSQDPSRTLIEVHWYSVLGHLVTWYLFSGRPHQSRLQTGPIQTYTDLYRPIQIIQDLQESFHECRNIITCHYPFVSLLL